MTAPYTVYANFPGPLWNNQNLLNSLSSGFTTYLIGWFDGEQRLRLFDNSVALPTLSLSSNTNPSSLPPSGSSSAGYGQAGNPTYGSGTTPAINGYVQVCSGLALWQEQYVDTAGNAKLGGYWFSLTFAAGSMDGGSPGEFTADLYLGLILTSLPNG
jgi:hypothetical protein